MSDNPVKNVLNELFPYFERLETQSAAILQILRDKGVVSNEELEGYLEQAGTASDIKWRAARVRMERLTTPSDGDKEQSKGEEAKVEEAKPRQASSEQERETPENLAAPPESSEVTTQKTKQDQGAQPADNTQVATEKLESPKGEDATVKSPRDKEPAEAKEAVGHDAPSSEEPKDSKSKSAA